MSASVPGFVPKGSRKWLAIVAVVVVLGSAVALASWYFTAPLEIGPPGPSGPVTSPTKPPPPKPAESRPAWPSGTLDGPEAKALVLAIVEDAAARLDRVDGYTATFRKQERIAGTLNPEQTLAMKVRHRPFAIYLKFLAPKAGKEVIFAEGHNGDKLIVHNGDWTRRLVPRLAIEPTSPTAMAESRHPITDAGIGNLAHKLVAFRKLDIEDPEAVTVLDRTTGPDGRLWARATHTHPAPNPSRPYARVVVLFDPVSLLPRRIDSYDWPAAGETGELRLAESYAYDDLVLDAPLRPADFDPANPDYAFLRY